MWTIAGGIIIAWLAIKLAGAAYRATQSVGFTTKLACVLYPKHLKYEDPAVIRERIYCEPDTSKAYEHNLEIPDDAERQTHDAREEKCTRCNGTGEWRGYLGLDGICYSCGGTGKRGHQ